MKYKLKEVKTGRDKRTPTKTQCTHRQMKKKKKKERTIKNDGKNK